MGNYPLHARQVFPEIAPILGVECNLCLRGMSQENWDWMSLRFRESVSWQMSFHYRINSIWVANAGKKGLLQPLWGSPSALLSEMGPQGRGVQKTMPVLMRNAEDGGRRRVWESIQDLWSLSPVTSVVGCTVALPHSHPFRAGFRPVKGLHVSVPVCCLSFHLDDVSHTYMWLVP